VKNQEILAATGLKKQSVRAKNPARILKKPKAILLLEGQKVAPPKHPNPLTWLKEKQNLLQSRANPNHKRGALRAEREKPNKCPPIKSEGPQERHLLFPAALTITPARGTPVNAFSGENKQFVTCCQVCRCANSWSGNIL